MVAACQGFHTRTPIHKHICIFRQPEKWRSLLSLWQATLHDRWPVFNVMDLNISHCIGNAVFGLPVLFRKQRKGKKDRKRVNCWQVQQIGWLFIFRYPGFTLSSLCHNWSWAQYLLQNSKPFWTELSFQSSLSLWTSARTLESLANRNWGYSLNLKGSKPTALDSLTKPTSTSTHFKSQLIHHSPTSANQKPRQEIPGWANKVW